MTEVSQYWKISEGPKYDEFYFDEDDAKQVYAMFSECVKAPLKGGKAATVSVHLVEHEYDEDDKENYFLGNDEECDGDEVKYEVYALVKAESDYISEDELYAHVAKLHAAKYGYDTSESDWEFLPLTQYQYEDLKSH
jgi:hypothetical protein